MTEQQLKVRFFKLHKNALSPTQAHDTDAGWDVYYCPKEGEEQVVSIAFGRSALLGTGIKCEIPDGWYLEVKDRSGTATKQGLKIGACVDGSTGIETNKGIFSASTLNKSFCERNNILIKSYNLEKDCVEYKRCDGFRIARVNEAMKITFEDNSELICDSEHFVLDENKLYKDFSVLNVGDKVFSP